MIGKNRCVVAGPVDRSSFLLRVAVSQYWGHSMRRHRLLDVKFLFFGHTLEVNLLKDPVRGGL